MELVPFKPAAGALVVAGGGANAGSIPAMVAAQQDMLHKQVDQLQNLVVTQCRLTGVNPLAQEMAAGALSIKIGKKPRDLLNPKALKCMQSLFALKDTIGKKETREISLLSGVTVTQVREFFASQRSRVRKFVNLSREKALRIETSKVHGNLCSITTEQTSLDIEARAEVVEPLRTLEPVEIPQSSSKATEIQQFYLQPMEAPQSSLQPTDVLPNSLQQAEVQQNHTTPIIPSATIALQPADAKINPDSVRKETKEEGVVPGVESEDKKFLDSIFALMGKEETFSGQVKLMEWVLQINNVTILSWFLTMGGLTIVSTWLSEAAVEEQTSVILVIFKVLLHLPLHKALPDHMSIVLPTINRLRFYRTQDVSSKARILLSRLSKQLVRSSAMKKPKKELISKQSISEILGDESWKSEVDTTEEILALNDGTNENRKSEPRKTPMLLTASADEPNKKSVLQTKSKQKRKVLLVEHPNKKVAGKNAHSVRSISTNNSRPISADDIQKAKMRAMFMQEKYGKVDTGSQPPRPATVYRLLARARALNTRPVPVPVTFYHSSLEVHPCRSPPNPLRSSMDHPKPPSAAPDTPNPHVFTCELPHSIYALAFSPAAPVLASGSFLEDLHNRVSLLAFDPVRPSAASFRSLPALSFDHPYPPTKLQFNPCAAAPPLLASSSDSLRLWHAPLDDLSPTAAPPELRSVLDNRKASASEFCAPLTSFDWNDVEPRRIGTASIDTTCTVWDIDRGAVETQLIAHDKAVHDIAWGGATVFASVSADGSVRVFDLRDKDHSNIVYESPRPDTPLLRLAWNRCDFRYMAALLMDSSAVVVLDIRAPGVPVAELHRHQACANAVAWAPQATRHLCSAGDDGQALIWELPETATAVPADGIDPVLVYDAGAEINQLQWTAAHPDWMAIAFENKVQLLRV